MHEVQSPDLPLFHPRPLVFCVTLVSVAMSAASRYQPASLLHQEGIPCVVWFEDAVAHYGVPTVVFDLYLLVPDIDAAFAALAQHGWTLSEEQSVEYHFLRRHLDIRRRRLTPPGGLARKKADDLPALPITEPHGPTYTVLLCADDWGFPPEKLNRSLVDGVFPKLCDLLDALIESVLDCDPMKHGMAEDHLAVHICYLYDHAPELKERAFAERLKYENRQFHHDIVSGLQNGTRILHEHERRVRDELRAGTRELKECSLDRTPENEMYFSGYLPPDLRRPAAAE